MNSIGDRLESERKRQGRTLRELAAQAGVSASLLCSIEKGRVNPSVGTLFEISNALGVHPQFFFVADEAETAAVAVAAEPLIGVARAAEDPRPVGAGTDPARRTVQPHVLTPENRPTLRLTDGVIWQLLMAQPDDSVEFMEVEYPPGASSGEEMFSHPGREFGLVLAGEVTLDVGFERFVLRAGDSIGYESTTPHRLENTGTEPMRAVWVNCKRA